MQFVELIVNVPLRRTFSKRHDPPPEELFGDSNLGDPELGDGESVNLQVFHYHLPPQLENRVAPGHLVWATFGRRQVQGIVVRLSDTAPVPTKPISKLARPEPVLNQTQLTLAAWIADYYVASLVEAIKLFIPPGLLSKDEESKGMQARRELQIELAVAADEALRMVAEMGRDTVPSRMLDHLLRQPTLSSSLVELKAIWGAKVTAAIASLIEKNLIERQDDHLVLAIGREVATERLEQMRGISKSKQVISALLELGTPVWKSDLYRRVDADLELLRQLQVKGIVRLEEQVRFRDPLRGRHYPQTFAPAFTPEQQSVWNKIADWFSASDDNRSSRSVLLHGVTGSGKTEIYLRAISETLRLGRQAIVLVPEIALTPQTVARFAGRFPGRVTVIHSELNAGERYDVWRGIRAGEFEIVIGARSALFAPLASLGLIIIDEEHESSYKQDSEEWGSFTVFYDARTVAKRLAEQTQSLLIFGSATPSLDIYYACQQGGLTLLEMPRRVMGHRKSEDESLEVDYAEMPPVELVDMRQELRAGNRSIISRSLLAELQTTIQNGEQAILFLNRRGAFTFVLCRDCGHVERCPRCDVPYVYHEKSNILVCHHCNHSAVSPTVCPQCASKRIKFFGSGTERIEEVVQQMVPHAQLLRWDADTTTRKGSHAEILQQFAEQKANVLIGTQMIAKGLDLPLVTLVGAIAADTGLHLPDFRSAERTFQLLTQVAGRSGRSARGGRVVIQTYSPQHYAIQAAAKHDYKAFFERELDFRKAQGYPPVKRMAKLVYWERNPTKAQHEAERFATLLRNRLNSIGVAGKSSVIIGPAPSFFARFRGYYRWQILLIALDPTTLLRSISIPIGWRIDIDPLSLL